MAIVLTFARAVGTAKIVDAIVEALSDTADKASLSTFKSLLTSSLGPGGGSTGDKIDFVYYGKDLLTISVRGKEVGSITSAELRNNLLGIYLGEKTRVPPLRAAFINYFGSK
jgi:Chalcone isomerase-like